MYSGSRSQGWAKPVPPVNSGTYAGFGKGSFGGSSSLGSRMGSSSLGMGTSSSLDHGLGSGTYSSLGSSNRISEPYTGEKREWGYSSSLGSQRLGGGSSGSLSGGLRESAYRERDILRRQEPGLMEERRLGMREPLGAYPSRSSSDLGLGGGRDPIGGRDLDDQMGNRVLQRVQSSDSWSSPRDVGLSRETSYGKGASIMNYFCKVCKIKLLSLKNFAIHASGSSHQRKVNELQYQLGSDFSGVYGDPDEPEAVMESQPAGDTLGRMEQLNAPSAGLQRSSDLMQQQPRSSLPMQEMGMSGQQRNMGQFGQQGFSSSNSGQMAQSDLRYDDRMVDDNIRPGRNDPGSFRNMTKILDSVGIRDEEGLTNLIGAAVKNVRIPGEMGGGQRFPEQDRFQEPGINRDNREPRMGLSDMPLDIMRGGDRRVEAGDRFAPIQRDNFQGRARDDMRQRETPLDRGVPGLFDDRRPDDRSDSARRDDRGRRDRERPPERWSRNRSPLRREERGGRDLGGRSMDFERDRGLKRRADARPEEVPFKMRMEDDRDRINLSQQPQMGQGNQRNQMGQRSTMGMEAGNIGMPLQGNMAGPGINRGNLGVPAMNLGNMGGAGINQGNIVGAGMNQGNLRGLGINQGLNQGNMGGPGLMQGNTVGPNINRGSMMAPNMNQANLMGLNVNQGNMMGSNMNQGNMMGPDMNQGNMVRPQMNLNNMQGIGQSNMGPMNVGNMPANRGPEPLEGPSPMTSSVTSDELEIARQIGTATGIGDMSILMQGVRLVKDLDSEVLQSLVGLTSIFEALSSGKMSMDQAARRLPPAVAEMLMQGNIAPEVVQMLIGMSGGGPGKPVQSLLDLNLGRARRGRGRDNRGRGTDRGRGGPRGAGGRRESPDRSGEQKDSSRGDRVDRGRGGFRGRGRGRGFGSRRGGLNRAASGIKAKVFSRGRGRGGGSKSRGSTKSEATKPAVKKQIGKS